MVGEVIHPCGGGYTIHLSYGVVVEEVIHPVEEVILLLRFYCHPQSQLGIGIRGLGLGLDKNSVPALTA